MLKQIESVCLIVVIVLYSAIFIITYCSVEGGVYTHDYYSDSSRVLVYDHEHYCSSYRTVEIVGVP